MERALKMMAERRVGARARLGSDVELLLDRDGFVLLKTAIAAVSENVEVGVPLAIAGTPWRLLIVDEEWDASRSLQISGGQSEYVDAETIKGSLHVRWPRAGDVFYPLGMQRPKKINDFFADGKVPLRRRKTTPVLECEGGIVWVCGFRIDERFKVTGKTKRVLHLQLIQTSEAV
jgi:tRNA(Ile)-lysidine synthetase-like protein